MYTRGQLEGMMIFYGCPNFFIVNKPDYKWGYQPQYRISLRVDNKFIEPIRKSLLHLGIETRTYNEMRRAVRTIIITRKESVIKALKLVPIHAVTKNDKWEVFIQLMKMIEDGLHLTTDGRYEFERLLNENKRQKT